MNEMLCSVAVFALLKHLEVPLWLIIPLIIGVLLFDYAFKQKTTKEQADYEAFKLLMKGPK